QRLHASPQVLDLRHGECRVVVPDAERALADVDQPVLVAIDERPQQDAAHDAEDRRVGADAEREREHHGHGQPPGARERAERQPELVKKCHGAWSGKDTKDGRSLTCRERRGYRFSPVRPHRMTVCRSVILAAVLVAPHLAPVWAQQDSPARATIPGSPPPISSPPPGPEPPRIYAAAH